MKIIYFDVIQNPSSCYLPEKITWGMSPYPTFLLCYRCIWTLPKRKLRTPCVFAHSSRDSYGSVICCTTSTLWFMPWSSWPRPGFIHLLSHETRKMPGISLKRMSSSWDATNICLYAASADLVMCNNRHVSSHLGLLYSVKQSISQPYRSVNGNLRKYGAS